MLVAVVGENLELLVTIHFTKICMLVTSLKVYVDHFLNSDMMGMSQTSLKPKSHFVFQYRLTLICVFGDHHRACFLE